MSRRLKLLCGLLTAIGVAGVLYLARPITSQGDSETEPKEVPAEILYKPTAVPDRIILTWKGDVATTQAVTWRTDTTVKTPVAEIAEAEAGPWFVTKAKKFEGTTTPLETDLGPSLYHSVDFTGLTPNTLYVYRVGDGVNWSSWTHFRTASPDAEPFSFIYFGDAQNALKAHWARVIREAYSDAPDAKFMLHAGDLVNVPIRDAEWGEWNQAGGWVNGMIPSIAIPGNHEYAKEDIYGNKYPIGRRRLAPHWRPSFAFPDNGPPGQEEAVYWLDFQGLRIVCLNTNDKIAEQAAWMDEVLTDNPNKWTIVTQHAPIYSASRRRDNPQIRNAWQPVFDKHRVDLVLQGHDHSYGRTGLMGFEQENTSTGINVRNPKAGTVYVVSVSGPKMYDRNEFPFVRRAEDTQLYQVISIDGDELRYDARTATGELYDAFTIKKRDGQVNELIERVPDTPQRMRPASREG